MRILSSLFACFIWVQIFAQDISIIPKPASMRKEEGFFLLSKKVVIRSEQSPGDIEFTDLLNNFLKTKLGYQLRTLKLQQPAGKEPVPEIIINADDNESASEAYGLIVSKNKIEFTGSPAGLFYALQTFGQLLPITQSKVIAKEIRIPAVTINDQPKFAYRGMHLDVGRHFFPIAFIKKYIDFLAYHKLNKFHWHLTEDQGWRIEIKQYPLLTTVGSKRNGTIIGRYPGKGNDNKPHAGFYTQAEIKEVVEYAKDRFIEVIPEIEMPGHSSAAIAAYPWLSCFPNMPTKIPANMISQKSAEEQKNGRIKLVQETWGIFDDVFCAGNDSTFLFLQNIIDEVTALFPSKYFHIGGDECPKTHWKICTRCQQRIKELGLKDEYELQSYFTQRIEKYLNKKGKILIGWDEILEGGLAPNAIVMSWRGEAGGIEAAKQKHQVIMSPGKPVYFDHTQSKNEDSVTIGGYNPIEAVYAYEPVPKELNEEQSHYILGAQANVWTEYMNNTRKIEYMIFPRMAALSEVLWSKKENKSWEDFSKRLSTQLRRYEMMNINYSKAFYEPESKVLPSGNYNELKWFLKVKNQGAAPIGVYRMVRLDKPDSMKVYNKAGKVIHYRYINEKKELIGIIDPEHDFIPITQDGKYIAMVCTYKKIGMSCDSPVSTLQQSFHFSKSTGKKASLTNPPSNSYPGDGAFTLLNGIINEKGRERSHEFIGFSGTDCEAVIDLGKEDTISSVTAHVLSDNGAWIWPPATITVQISNDGVTYSPVTGGGSPLLIDMTKLQMSFPAVTARFVKVF